MEIYYKKDIAEIINRPVRTITQWTDSGFVVPEVKASRGKGKARIYSKRNVIEFAMIDILSGKFQIFQKTVKVILDSLRGDPSWRHRGAYPINKPKFTEFEDFFENPEWGNKKELAFITEGFAYFDVIPPPPEVREITNDDVSVGFYGRHHFQVVESKEINSDLGIRNNLTLDAEMFINSDSIFREGPLPDVIERPVVNVLWLGSVKSFAITLVEKNSNITL